MSVLIVAEKPSVAMSIAKVVGAEHKGNGYTDGNGYIVTWCVGHLIGLAPPEAYGAQYAEKKWAVETLPILPEAWKFGIHQNTRQQFDVLKKLMNDASVSEIVCATDAGREGECIFRYVYQIAGCKKPFKRLWISSLEESAIRGGLQNLRPSSEFDLLFSAGLCRTKADWLIGMNGTRLFSAVYHQMLSIGRVQTPTLAMIVERDFKVKHFVKEKYFKVHLNCGSFWAATEKIAEESVAKQIVMNCKGKNATVTSLKKEMKTVNAPKLYDLTTLQREANRFFSFSAQQTLDLTQALYEKKLVTYPRTDSQYLTEDMEETAEQIYRIVMEKMPFISEYNGTVDIKRVLKNSGVSDHHALIPTAENASIDFDSLPDGERKILFLIANRLVCAVSAPHRYEAVTATLLCGGHTFTAQGKNVINGGWRAIEQQFKAYLKSDEEAEETDDEQRIAVSEGDSIENPTPTGAQHWTSPPKHYTEDTLLSAMETAGNTDYEPDSDIEKKGLGTPATRAAIIETLIKRAYIERKKKNLLATEKGIRLIQTVPQAVKSAKLTADWETELQGIEKGTANATGFMQKITAFVTQLVAEHGSGNADTSSLFQNQKAESIGSCPNCGAEVKKGKFGFYCTGKCSMQLAKVYGKELTETQLKKLLSGSSVSFQSSGKTTTVLPEIAPHHFTDKDGNARSVFQWQTKK